MKIIGRKRHQSHLEEDFVYINFEITKNFYNRDDGENDKEPGPLTHRLLTATRRDSRQYNLVT